MQMKTDNKCTTSMLQESENRPRKHATHHCSNSKATIPSPSSWRWCSPLLLCTDVKITFTGSQSPHPSSWRWCVHHLLLLRQNADGKITVCQSLHPQQLKMVYHLLLLRQTADDKITVWQSPPRAAEDGTYTTCYCWGTLMSRSHTASPHTGQLKTVHHQLLLRQITDELYGLYVGGSWHHKYKLLPQV